MAKKQENTRVEVTYKNGNKEVFDTIELASEKTGLPVNSIKSRANKPGSGAKSKDGMTFIWADPSVRRSQMAKKNKNKGNSFELEVVHKLREIGYVDCVSARSQDKRADANKIDIVDPSGTLPINIQCKYTQNTPSYFDISEACSDKSKPFCLAWKKTGKEGSPSPGTLVMIPIDYFYYLITRR